MKKTIQIPIINESQILMTDITYTQVPYWFDATLRPLKMDIIMPKHRENHPRKPLLVWICGGGMQTMDKDVWIPDIVSYTDRGYVVASISYRTYPDDFTKALKDVKAAIRYLKAHADLYCIDAARTVIMGESAGGILACAAGITNEIREFDEGEYLDYSSKVQAVVSLYGPVIRDFVTPELDDMIKRLLKENKEHIPPFFVMQGTEDTLVDKKYMDQMYCDLEESGIECDYYVLEGAGHGADEFYQTEVKNLVSDFFNKAIVPES